MEWWHILLIVLGAILLWFGLSVVLYRPFFKRFYDILLSGVAVIVFSPLLLFLMILTAVKMGGNPFFIQPRPGKNGKIFKLIKLRTMTNKRDTDGNLLPDDQRLTKYGRILRATSLDELFSLINIIKGDLSIVGPRPQLVKDLVFMDEMIRRRHTVRPGLTGLAQVNGRNNQTWEQRFTYDLTYVQSYSIFMDIAILCKTVFKVFTHADIATDGMATSMDYGDWLLQEGKITQTEYDAIIQTMQESL